MLPPAREAALPADGATFLGGEGLRSCLPRSDRTTRRTLGAEFRGKKTYGDAYLTEQTAEAELAPDVDGDQASRGESAGVV